MIVTIISGASRGIGAAITDDLNNLDHQFILLSKSNDIQNSNNAIIRKIDFENYGNVYLFIKYMLAELENIQQINIILCASQLGSFNCFDLQEMDKLYKSNVLGNIAIIRAASLFNVQKMRVVFFAGGGAAFAYPEFFGYSLSKVATVRAVENLSISLNDPITDFSIIALAPGAVNTDMLKKVIESGSKIRTRTDISEPVAFVRKFILDEIDSRSLNGMFFHVRDDLSRINEKKDIYKLRRIE